MCNDHKTSESFRGGIANVLTDSGSALGHGVSSQAGSMLGEQCEAQRQTAWVTPLTIRMAIDFYTIDGYQPDYAYPSQRETVKLLIDRGLIEGTPHNWRPNHEALKAYLDTLCQVPFPVKRWVMP